MPQPLDAIIREIEPKEHGARDEAHVRLDGKNRPVKAGLTAPLKTARHFLVHTTRVVKREGLSISLTSLQAKLDVQVAYQVRCSDGGAEKLAAGVAGAPNPQAALDSHIEASLDRFKQAKGLASIIDFFDEKSLEFRTTLASELASDLGLLLVDFSMAPGKRALESRKLGPITLQVTPADCSLTLDIELEAMLLVDQTRKTQAHAKEFELERLVHRLTLAARDHLNEGIGLHALYTKLDGSIRSDWIGKVKQEVAEHGRQLSAVAFRCEFQRHDALAGVRTTLQHQVAVEYHPQNHPNVIHINAGLNLKLFDVAKLVAAKVSSLEAWADESVRRISRDLLFKLSHESFCSRFEDQKAKLEAEVRAAALAIGYTLDDFFTITDHQIDNLMKGVTLGPLIDSYVLKSTNQLRVKLRLSVDARIEGENLKTVLQRVVRNENVREDMEQALKAAATKFLAKVTPESFYVYFDAPRDGEEWTTGQQLEKALRQHLFETFGAEVTDYNATQLETEVTSLIDRLRKVSPEVVLAIEPPHHPVEHFEVDFQVLGVHRDLWGVFQAKLPEIADVERAVKAQLESALSHFKGQQLIKQEAQVAELAGLKVKEAMLATFGLVVGLLRFHRRRNAWEMAAGEEVQASLLDDVARDRDAREEESAQGKLLRGENHRTLAESLAHEQTYRAAAAEQRTIGNTEEADRLDDAVRREQELQKEIRSETSRQAAAAREKTAQLAYAGHGQTPLLSNEESQASLEEVLKEARRRAEQPLELQGHGEKS
jgi:hypothetical protein